MIKIAKKKFAFKLISKIILSAVVIVYIVFAPIIIFPILSQNRASINHQIQIDYMGILELWNVDTFEGGSVSRTNYLEKRAMEFEKKYQGTFIMVSSISMEQMVLNLESGSVPDIISFGIGAGEKILTNLVPLSSDYGTRDDLIKGGQCNSIQYAIPYILGGYSLVSDNGSQEQEKQVSNMLGCGLSGYTNPFLSLIANNIETKSHFEENEKIDSFTAYDKYLSKKFDTLLGTQRDLYRIENRIEKGTMAPRSFYNLGGFSDLVQYIGVCSKDAVKQDISKKFISFLTQDSSQDKISNINMFSTTGRKIYTSGMFADMEQNLSDNIKTLNVFLSNEKIEEIKSLSVRYLLGEKDLKKEIMKYLI